MDARLVAALATQYGGRGAVVGGWFATLSEEVASALSYRSVETLLAAMDEAPSVNFAERHERDLWAIGATAFGIPHPERLIHWLWYSDGGSTSASS